MTQLNRQYFRRQMTEKCDLTPRRAFQKCLVFDDDGRKYSKHFNNWTEKKVVQ